MHAETKKRYIDTYYFRYYLTIPSLTPICDTYM